MILRALLGPRLCRAATFPQSGFDFLRERLTDRQVSLLTYSDVDDPADIQLMGLYQSKGREADATIVVLRGNDYFGMESEPLCRWVRSFSTLCLPGRGRRRSC